MRKGGSYAVGKSGGEPKRMAFTKDHAKGPRARDAEGEPIVRPEIGTTAKKPRTKAEAVPSPAAAAKAAPEKKES